MSEQFKMHYFLIYVINIYNTFKFLYQSIHLQLIQSSSLIRNTQTSLSLPTIMPLGWRSSNLSWIYLGVVQEASASDA